MADLTMPGSTAVSIPVPPAGGAALYFDSTTSTWSSKNSAGNAAPVAPNQDNTSSVAASAAISTVETVVTPSTPIPANFLQIGSTYRIVVSGTCTSTVANLSTFTLRLGTAGTVADTAIATVTCTAAAAGAAVPFEAVFYVTIRSLGAAGSAMASGYIVNSGITGISATGVGGGGSTATAAVNTTVSNFVEVSYKSAATTTACTFQMAIVELVK
ncbi:MAG: hypothetical protein ACYDH4_10630, partial [Candidatus Cryosericum sp.]